MQVCVIARDRSGLQHHNGNVCRARAKAPSVDSNVAGLRDMSCPRSKSPARTPVHKESLASN